MSASVLVTVVMSLVMAKLLADMYAGGRYTCPSCGAKNERRHSSDCPWGRFPSE
jgi:hypothetical protein